MKYRPGYRLISLIKFSGIGGFQALGLKHFYIEMLWIFDNEIDWVIQGRAHFGSPGLHSQGCESAATRKVFKCKKSVFKEKGSGRVSGQDRSQGEKSRLTLIRTEVIQHPALELILWSSY